MRVSTSPDSDGFESAKKIHCIMRASRLDLPGQLQQAVAAIGTGKPSQVKHSGAYRSRVTPYQDSFHKVLNYKPGALLFAPKH
jgi:hypothetical protein